MIQILLMSKDDSNLSHFANEIRDLLKNNEEKYNAFEHLLEKYSANEISPSAFISSLEHLFEGNKKVILKIHEVIKGPFQCEKIVSTYLEMTSYIQNFLQSSKIKTNHLQITQYLTLIIHLTINELLPISFPSIKLKTMSNIFTQKFIQKFNGYLHSITQFPNASILIRDLYCRQNPAQSFYFTTSSLKPTFPIQLLVVAHLQIKSEENLKSFVRCLSLFSLGFISFDDTLNWISKIDPILSEVFSTKKNIGNIPPHTFHPSKIFEHISQSNLTNSQIQWIFGQNIFQEFSTPVSLNGENLSDSMTKLKSSLYKQQYMQDIEPSIPEMKSVTFFHSMKTVIKYFQSGESLSGIEESLKSLYGQSFSYSLDEIGSNLPFLLQIYERFKKVGAEAQKSFAKLMKQKLDLLEISSHEWRIQYWPLMKKSYLNRQIVFNGFHYHKFDVNIQNKTFYFLNPFVKRFESILKAYDMFNQMLRGGSFYSNIGAALSLIYFIEINKMIKHSDTDQLTKKKLEEIAALLFTANPPLIDYFGQFISNIDIPARNFVQSLNKFSKSKIGLVFDLSQTIGLIEEEFVYHIIVDDEYITISALPNYIL